MNALRAEQRFDLMLVDVHTGNLDGFALAERMVADPDLSGV